SPGVAHGAAVLLALPAAVEARRPEQVLRVVPLGVGRAGVLAALRAVAERPQVATLAAGVEPAAGDFPRRVPVVPGLALDGFQGPAHPGSIRVVLDGCPPGRGAPGRPTATASGRPAPLMTRRARRPPGRPPAAPRAPRRGCGRTAGASS